MTYLEKARARLKDINPGLQAERTVLTGNSGNKPTCFNCGAVMTPTTDIYGKPWLECRACAVGDGTDRPNGVVGAIGPEPSVEDWTAIEAEAARWYRDADGVWHSVESGEPTARRCEHCNQSKDLEGFPDWRRRGKIIERSWPNGRTEWACHFCGRAV